MKKILSNIFRKKPKYPRRLGYTVDELTRLYPLNSELIPIIRRAKSGSITAQYDLYKTFLEGKEVKKDLNMAGYYLLLTMHTVSKDFDNYENILQYLALLIEYAELVKEEQNYEELEKVCYDIILFMQDYIPFKEWDFSIFLKIENLMNYR